jgi:phosphatidylglycerophosphatase A
MADKRSIPFGRRVVHFLASGFGVGRIPAAPGTWGTLVAVPIYLALREVGWWGYAAATVALFVAGIWICAEANRDWGDDASSIVWDEIVGFLVAMFMVPPGWGWVVAGFILFRVFDIVKPFPIGAVDRRIRGGVGTMLDDVLAGLYTLGLLHIAVFVIGA